MRIHSDAFKNEIKLFGRQFDSIITYGNETLGNEQINSITYNVQGDILKSCMKEVQVDTNVNIPLNTLINVQYGVFNYDENQYEYVDLGNYYVIESEKQEDSNSYLLKCYDKMIFAMKDYEDVMLTYPTTVKDYIAGLCSNLNITFANANETFANYDKEVPSDLYKGLGYTYRDVLDELAQVTASTICLNEYDELEIRYIQNVGEYETATGSSIHIDNVDDGNDLKVSLKGDTQQNTTTGKNLLPISPFNNGYSLFTLTGDVVTQNNTTSASWAWGYARTFFRTTLSAGTYTLMMFADKLSTYNSAEFRVYKNDGTMLADSGDRQKDETGNVTFTLSEETQIGVIAKMYDGAWKFMLVTGSTPDYNYEKYTGGNPAPNPSYPQPVNVVTGDNEVNVVGKNIFNKDFRQGSWFSTTTANRVMFNKTLPIKAGTYTFTTNLNLTTYRYAVDIANFTSPSATAPNVYDSGWLSVDHNTFTINEDGYFYVGIKKSDESDLTPSDINGFNYQLEKGTTATSYEAYQSQTYPIYLGVENLFDISTITAGKTINEGTGNVTIGASDRDTSDFIKVKPNTQYTCSTTMTRYAYYDENKTFKNFYTRGTTITTNSDTQYIRFSYDNSLTNIQFEKGSKANSYSPYGTTPIELCKIGDYQDELLKSTGKNLFDITQYPFVSNVAYENGAKKTWSGYSGIDTYFPVEPNTTYTFSNSLNQSIYYGLVYYDESKAVLSYVNSATKTFTTPNNCKYIRFAIHSGIPEWVQLEKSSSETEYEPYGVVWYIHKEIGKVVLDGSEDIANNQDYISIGRFNITSITNTKGGSAGNPNAISTHFLSKYETANGNIYVGFNGNICLIDTDYSNNLAGFKSWLGTNNPIVYYVLKTPTNTIITDTELIEQLESIRLLNGVNNITVSSTNVPSPLEVTYLGERDTIDEEYLKETNVNFGAKYGPINSIVLSRSAESDNVYLRDEQSILQNGLCEIKIKDNQIMNFNNRSDFLPDIFSKLNGLEYYEMDVDSTGVCYYELCDRYNIHANNKDYLCVLFNDEIDITQGLEEHIYNELPTDGETEYKYADKTDKKINQAYLIVDKQNVQIQALTQTTSNIASEEQTHYQEMLSKMDDKASISDIETITNQVNVLQTDTYTKTEINKIIDGTDENGLRVQVLQSTSAILNEDGMTYNKTGANTSSNINQAGVTVTNKKNNSELLFAGYDEQKLEALVRVANLYLTRFLGLDVWRIEIINDTTNGKGLGFFYIG